MQGRPFSPTCLRTSIPCFRDDPMRRILVFGIVAVLTGMLVVPIRAAEGPEGFSIDDVATAAGPAGVSLRVTTRKASGLACTIEQCDMLSCRPSAASIFKR